MSGEGGDLPFTDASCSAGNRLMFLKDFFLIPFMWGLESEIYRRCQVGSSR